MPEQPEKKLKVAQATIVFYSIQYKNYSNRSLATSDLFNMFTQSIKFYLIWKFIQIDIRDRDSDSDSYSLFQVIVHSNLLYKNDSYKKTLSALKGL